MQLSEHFSLEEATFSQTATRMGIANQPDDRTLSNMVLAAKGMERVRDLLGHSIHVSSWFRCLRLNTAIGSKPSSDHITGWAIDFICPKFGTPLEVCKAIVASDIAFTQIIQEGRWVHISFNPNKSRSILTAHFDAAGHATYQNGLHET